MASNTRKNSQSKELHWIRRYVKQFGCKAVIISCGDTIIRFPKEHCSRYVPGEVEARKIVAVMKETSLYTGVLQRNGNLDCKRHFRELILTFGPFFGNLKKTL